MWRKLMSPTPPPPWNHFLLLWAIATLASAPLQAASVPTTDPKEVRAFNEIYRKWNISASNSPIRWLNSEDICRGLPTEGDIKFYDNDNYNPYIVCSCDNSTCHITRFKAHNLSIVGRIPEELQDLQYLDNLQIALNYLTGPLPAFIGNFSAMKYLSVGRNAFTGPVPKELGNLKNLLSLGIDTCNFNGSLPSELGNLTSLEQMYIDSMGVGGKIPNTFVNLKKLRILWAGDNNFGGQVPQFIGNLTALESMKFKGNSFEGPVPPSYGNLKNLGLLHLCDLSNGISSLSFIRNLTSLSTLVLRNSKILDTLPDLSNFLKLQTLDLSFNNLTGQVPQSLFSLPSLENLFLGNNSFSGELPEEKSSNLLNIDLSYNDLSGGLPSWVTEDGLQLNLVANNFIIEESEKKLRWATRCLQKNFPCYLGSPVYYSFAINCGGDKVVASDGTEYEADNADLSAASYQVQTDYRWAVSSTGMFLEAPEQTFTAVGLLNATKPLNSELFHTARLSPSSLRYYGLALENGNYTVSLEFSETAFRDDFIPSRLGRRVFDIYIQGILVAKDFNIMKEAGERSFTQVIKNYTTVVTKNNLEIHLFWAGKGTTAIPTMGTYGPSISAISVTPNFKPTVSNHLPRKGKSSRTAVIASTTTVAVAAMLSILVLVALLWRRKRRNSNLDGDEGLHELSTANTFSYTELKEATRDFSPSSKLGEGGFGSVFKGKLSDGRDVAVKQLSAATGQGKEQFVTEIATISAVQHRNLVKLYGCCYEGDNRLLVYEYLENKSLDHALFGKNNIQLDWQARFNICLGTARGLAYLHEESRLRIIHRDVKASNILLDADLEPKISDFGLAKLYDDKMTHISTRVAGTFGYLAPEYAMRGHLTEKADVFGFGVVTLEILTGRQNVGKTHEGERIYLLEWAWQVHEINRDLDMVDSKLASYDKEEAIRMIHVAFLCTQLDPMHRPSMSRVVSMLVGGAEIGEIPPMPAYTEWKYDEVPPSHMISSTSDSSVTLLTSQTTTNADSWV